MPGIFISEDSNKASLLNVLFSFQGRIPRSTFWKVGIGILLTHIGFCFALYFLAPQSADGKYGAALGVLMLTYFFIVIWTSFAVCTKRWHDRDKSGWWYLINFVPFIGSLWAFIECGFLPGSRGINRYGPDPV